MAYSKPKAYSEPWYIQNSGTIRTRDIFRILGFSEPEAYSEPCQTSTIERNTANDFIFVSYNYFHNIRFSCPLVHE